MNNDNVPKEIFQFNYPFARIVSIHGESSLIVFILHVKVQMLAEIPATTTGGESMATRVTDPVLWHIIRKAKSNKYL